MNRIIVIGGGFAGLSAATALAEKGMQVTVLEGRQVLGGRAYSFVDPQTGDAVDNGQHLFMGCYRETFAFLRRIDALAGMDVQRSLTIRFIGSGARRWSLRCLPLPAPWHLYSGLLGLGTLSWADRWRLRHVEAALKQNIPAEDLDHITVDTWLTQCHQSARAKQNLWNLIAIACLNEDPTIASAAPFITVLRQAFFDNAEASRLAVANVGLSDLYVRHAMRFLDSAGSRVRAKAPVQRLEVRNGRVVAVVLRDGERLEADRVISAVPPWALAKFVPEEWLQKEPYFGRLKEFSYAPIISIHLWFDQAITKDRFVGLLDTHIQWLFNRSRILKTSSSTSAARKDVSEETAHISLVISGAHEFKGWSDNKIVSLAMEELRRLFPRARKAALVRSLVIKESQATLSPKVGTEALRPSWQSPIENLLVAGDLTRTGLPATIESACISGHGCADLIIKASSSLEARKEPTNFVPRGPAMTAGRGLHV